MDFPLESIHNQAFKLAEIVHCSGEQGKYWEMHKHFFEVQQTLKPEDWQVHGQIVGLDKYSFQQCIDSGKYASRIRRDMAESQKVGVISVPTFLLGFTERGGKVRVVKMIVGAVILNILGYIWIKKMMNVGV